MELHDFQQLLRSRFDTFRCTVTKGPDRPTFVNLMCSKCGWTCLFDVRSLEGWSMAQKGGLTDMLLRHVLCRGTYGT